MSKLKLNIVPAFPAILLIVVAAAIWLHFQSPWIERTLELEGVKIKYFEGGSGDSTIVLVPGTNEVEWQSGLADLTAKFHLLVFPQNRDLPFDFTKIIASLKLKGLDVILIQSAVEIGLETVLKKPELFGHIIIVDPNDLKVATEVQNPTLILISRSGQLAFGGRFSSSLSMFRNAQFSIYNDNSQGSLMANPKWLFEKIFNYLSFLKGKTAAIL